MADIKLHNIGDGDIVQKVYGLFYYDSSTNSLKALYREKRVIDMFSEMSKGLPVMKWEDVVKSEELNRVFNKGKEDGSK